MEKATMWSCVTVSGARNGWVLYITEYKRFASYFYKYNSYIL